MIHSMPHLNSRQEQFLRRYRRAHKVAPAAKAAGYKTLSAPYMLLKRDDVQCWLTDGKSVKPDQVTVTSKSRLEQELQALSFSDFREFATWDSDGVTLIPSTELSDAAAACVSSVTFTGGKAPTIKFTLWDKLKALRLLAQVSGALQPDQVTQINFNIPSSGDPRGETVKRAKLLDD